MGSNYSFLIVKYWKLIALRSLFVAFEIFFSLLFFLGVNRGTGTTFYERLGLVNQLTEFFLMIGGAMLCVILATYYFRIKCIIGSIIFKENKIILSTKNINKEVSYNNCIINNQKLSVLDVENNLNPGYSSFTFDDNGLKKKINFKIKIDDLYYLKQLLKEKQSTLPKAH